MVVYFPFILCIDSKLPKHCNLSSQAAGPSNVSFVLVLRCMTMPQVFYRK